MSADAGALQQSKPATTVRKYDFRDKNTTSCCPVPEANSHKSATCHNEDGRSAFKGDLDGKQLVDGPDQAVHYLQQGLT